MAIKTHRISCGLGDLKIIFFEEGDIFGGGEEYAVLGDKGCRGWGGGNFAVTIY